MAHDIEIIDKDPIETQEWLDALASVTKADGRERARFLVDTLVTEVGGASLPVAGLSGFTTPYVNTISPEDEAPMPGDAALEKRIQALIRWNAVAMVLRAGRVAADVGGHIATYASSAILYETGFNHFFHGPDAETGSDLIYYQGHGSPGIYARSFLEGRLNEADLELFRQEVRGKKGLSSYPHPWLMPEYWQFPTVSMGLGPIQAIYQARFLKYLHHRGLVNNENRKVWCFCGDGEMDEPESLGAITVAGRENLDNLIFVINCNLQRLDGPVRGNGKIIQELESVFRGAGWHVVKVIWGSAWDPLLAKDKTGLLKKRMMEAVDGEYQNYKAYGGAYTREHFFGKYPELKEMVADMSDDEIWRLNRGGHDPQKVYAAYARAVKHTGQPTVILVKTVKGYGMGAAGEALNITHQQKKMDTDSLKAFRDRFNIPVDDAVISEVPFYRPADNSPEIAYLKLRRQELGGFLPARRVKSTALTVPPLSAFDALLKSTGDRAISTTMAFVRALNVIIKDKNLGKQVVPIVPDEARTFGMEGLFRQIGIYSAVGQLYRPVDADQVMSYREDQHGQLLQEGINEGGAFCSWIAAGTSYSVSNLPMVPFYIFYSMFGFQRIGDLAWAAGDSRARGFLIGATAGRTTLAGEGLQHTDGHSLLMAAVIPNCIAYDPTFSYEMAVIIQEGLRRMYAEQESVFYYITAMNENYVHPEMPAGAESGILKGLYCLQQSAKVGDIHVHLMGSGTILREVMAAAELLQEAYGVTATVWSATSFNELRREGLDVERWNLLHPDKPARQSYVSQMLTPIKAPVVAATDYIRAYPDQIRAFVPHRYVTLGTDGFGRSDAREPLRAFFEVNRFYIVVAALKALADEGKLPIAKVQHAMRQFEIDPEKPNPVTL